MTFYRWLRASRFRYKHETVTGQFQTVGTNTRIVDNRCAELVIAVALSNFLHYALGLFGLDFP